MANLWILKQGDGRASQYLFLNLCVVVIRRSGQLNMWKQLQKKTAEDAADRTQHTGNRQSVQRCQRDIM